MPKPEPKTVLEAVNDAVGAISELVRSLRAARGRQGGGGSDDVLSRLEKAWTALKGEESSRRDAGSARGGRARTGRAADGRGGGRSASARGRGARSTRGGDADEGRARARRAASSAPDERRDGDASLD